MLLTPHSKDLMTMTSSPSPTSDVTADFAAPQRQLLEAERARILASVAAADRDLAELRERGGVAEVEFSEEGGEGASTASERAHLEALKSQLATRLAAVEAAVERMDAGVYGRCEACGGPIGEARLEAMPDATLCVACKSAPWTSRR